MKKLLAILLCIAMTVGMFAGCGGEKAPETNGGAPAGVFSVGYGNTIVSPESSVPLGGYNNSADRYSTSVEYPFNAVSVAFTDTEGETVLYIALDLLLCYGFVDSLRNVLTDKLGLPKDHIMIHCNHNHSGPDMNFDDPGIAKYTALLTTGVIASAEAAMADRKPATMETTFCRPERVNTVRHYLLADGNYQAEGVGAVSKDNLIGHYGVADNLLQLVRFNREGGKPVVMINWQGHPRGTDPSTIATGNYYSVMRSYLDKNLDCHSIFVLSGSGNLNNNSQIPGEVRFADYIELGEGLGAEAMEASKNFTAANVGNITITENNFETLGNSGMRTVPLYTMSFGDFAMAMAPFEIFDTNARGVREASDFKMTFYSSCTNKSMGYLPTDASFDWEIAYEVRITNFPKGTAQKIQDELTRMLAEQFAASGNEKQEKPEGYLQPEFVPATDGKTYTNPVPGKLDNYRAVNNGFFSLQLLEGTNIKNILTNSEDVAKEILAGSSMQLIFNEQNVVVGVVK
ncbi:MAG: hypothetical protein IKU07_04235 [Oscillospiraceae bacterium]|nr:hypothetical protein [Oscillospiraceae bacterium]